MNISGADLIVRLRERLMESGPLLIRVPIDEREHVLPMVAPGGANREAVDHPH